MKSSEQYTNSNQAQSHAQSQKPAAVPKPKSARRRSREFALQGIYQWLLSANDFASVISFLEEDVDFPKADIKYLQRLLEGIFSNHLALNEQIQKHIDRNLVDLSPIERSALLIGAYELTHCLDVPYKVIINEAVEVTKVFGGLEGYKYINGVLDKLAPEIRAHELVQTVQKI